MKYQISLFSGETILLDDEKYHRVLAAWDAGADEFNIEGRRINRKGIASIGYTAGATEKMRIEEQDFIRTLSPEDAKKLSEIRYKEACNVNRSRTSKLLESAKERVWKGLGGSTLAVEIKSDEQPALSMSNEESMDGNAEYWVDKDGVKHYE